MSHLNWIVAGSAIAGMVAVPIEILRTIKEIETAMAGMNQVIDHKKLDSEAAVLGIDKHKYAQEQLNKETEKFISIAASYGEKTTDIIEAGKLWGRLYKDLSIVNALTAQSAKLAVADNFSLIEANKALEAAMFQYGLTARDTTEAIAYSGHIIDVWTKLAHTAGASAQDLTQAVERTGSVAKMVGVDFEFLNALIATGVRSTGRSGAEIGNTLKTVFGSMHSSKAVEEVEKLGIAMYNTGEDGTKNLRKAQDVLLEIALAAQSTDKDLEPLFKQLSGGKFQWAKTAAMLGDYKELIRSWGEAVSSKGFTEGQIEMQMDTISRKLATLRADMDGLFVGVGNSGLTKFVKETIDSLDSVVLLMKKIPAEGYQLLAFAGKFALILYGIKITTQGLIAVKTAYSAVTLASSIALNAESSAAARAAAATSALGAAMTASTGGLNLILAAVIAAAMGISFFADSLTKAEKAERKINDSAKDNIAIMNQEMEQHKQQGVFLGSLLDARIRLHEEIKSGNLSTEKEKKAKEDLKATDKELTNIIDEEGLKRLEAAGWSKEACDIERKAHQEKSKEIRNNLVAEVDTQIKATDEIIEQTQKRIESYMAEMKVLNLLEKTYASLWDMKISTQKRELSDMNSSNPAVAAMAKSRSGMSKEQLEADIKKSEDLRERIKTLGDSSDEVTEAETQRKVVQALENKKSKLNYQKLEIINFDPSTAGGREVSDGDESQKTRGGNSSVPSDIGAKLAKNEWKMRKDDLFTQAKISADQYAESLSNLSLVESLYGKTAATTIAKQATMSSRISELAEENQEYQKCISELDNKINEVIDTDTSWLEAMNVTQDAWKAMSKEQRLEFKLQRRDVLESSDTLKNYTTTLNDFKEKSSETTKKIAEMRNEIVKMDFKDVFDKNKQLDRKGNELDYADKVRKASIKKSAPDYNEQARISDLTTVYAKLGIEKERLAELESQELELRKQLPEKIKECEERIASYTEKIKELKATSQDTSGAEAELKMAQDELVAATAGHTSALLENKDAQLQVKGNIVDLTEQSKTLEDKWKDVRSAGADIFSDLIVQGNSLKDIWKKLWSDLANDAIRTLLRVEGGSQGLLGKLAGLLGGGSKGSAFSDLGGFTSSFFGTFRDGGLIPGFADGGYTDGLIKGTGTGTSDSILTFLQNRGQFIKTSNGEYIVKKRAVDKYGVSLLDEINTGKFKDGGVVSSDLVDYATKGTAYIPDIDRDVIKQTKEITTDNQQSMETKQTNMLLTAMLNKMSADKSGGGVTVLSTRMSDQEILGAIARNPAMLQSIMGKSKSMGYK